MRYRPQAACHATTTTLLLLQYSKLWMSHGLPIIFNFLPFSIAPKIRNSTATGAISLLFSYDPAASHAD